MSETKLVEKEQPLKATPMGTHESYKTLIYEMEIYEGTRENDIGLDLSWNHEKIKGGRLKPGARIVIQWDMSEFIDEPDHQIIEDSGYLFELPGLSNDNFVVHVPHPENSGGKDGADAEWITLSALLCKENVKAVIVEK